MVGDTTVQPGAMLTACVPMRAWQDDEKKGELGLVLPPGDNVLVVGSWSAGNNVRLRVIYAGRVVVFSCAQKNLGRNWKVACAG